MVDATAMELERKPVSFWVPLSPFEKKRVDHFVAQTGIKRSVLVRKALMEYLDRAEQGEQS